MNKKRLSAWSIIGIFLFSWVGFFLFSGFSGNGALESQVGKHLESVALSKSERIGVFLDERKVDLEFLIGLESISDSFYSGVLNFELGEKLESFRSVNGYLDLVLIDIDGFVLWSSVDNKIVGSNLNDDLTSELGVVFEKVQNDFGVGIFDPGYFPPRDNSGDPSENEELSVFVTSPVLVESEDVEGKKDMLGIVALRIDNAEIEKRVVSDVGLGAGEIYLVNRYATPIVDLKGESGVQVTSIETEMSKDCFRDYQNYYFDKSGDVVTVVDKSGVYNNYMGKEVFGAHHYVLRTGWCVLVEKGIDDFYDSLGGNK